LPGAGSFAGWARTIQCVDVDTIDDDPYAKEIEALDSVLADEVVVVSTGHSIRNAPWGELLSTAAKARGARGAVIDGLVRDARKIEQLGFPVFATGLKPVDSKGRGIVTGYNVPIECGEVGVEPGDLIVADFDGVVCVPRAVVSEVIEKASAKASLETDSRGELMGGAYLRDVFKRHGIL
jgi:regulator of RNase E activity RraA